MTPQVQDRAAPAGIRAEDLRLAFRRHAAGVGVITASTPGGPVGFTVTSLVSVSAAPAMVSFTIARTSSCWDAVQRARVVGIHLLGADQAELAATFARSGADRFAPPTRWQSAPGGVPLLAGCPVRLVGEIQHRWPAGDHAIVVAGVRHVDLGSTDDPLLYHGGAFQRLDRGTTTDP